MIKAIILTISIILIHFSADAGVLATPSFDADSYIFMKTNNEYDPNITVGESQQGTGGHPHFNYGLMQFDVTSIAIEGDKFLRLSVIGYKDGSQGSAITPTGTSIVQLVALNAPISSYFGPGSGQDWYDTHVQNPGVTVIGTYSFTNQDTLYVDVTATVNAWINSSSNNYGFALYSIQNAVELGSANNTNAALTPALVDDAPVPQTGWESWQGTQFPGLPEGSGAYDDYDHDGVQNLLEYITGTDPTSSHSYKIPILSEEDGYMTLTIQKENGVDGFNLSVEASSNLNDWDIPIIVLTDSGEVLKVRLNFLTASAPYPQLFLRARAVVTP